MQGKGETSEDHETKMGNKCLKRLNAALKPQKRSHCGAENDSLQLKRKVCKKPSL